MIEPMVLQGRRIDGEHIELIERMMATNPQWGRSRISVELCRLWKWERWNGEPKDMACRTLLLKLERRGLLRLPARRGPSPNGHRNRSRHEIAHDRNSIEGTVGTIGPLSITAIQPRDGDWDRFNFYLSRYHYLGYRNSVGENLKYLVRDGRGREVACVLFGSAAWKSHARDGYIGWDRAQRAKHLQGVTNNTRFLILPWVRVKNLASHVLARIAGRVRADWENKYGHPVSLLETFVDRTRFQGTCYQAANWICLGPTTGRTRSDTHHRIQVAQKDLYVYPLVKDFRAQLARGS